MAAFANLRPPASFQRFIDCDVDDRALRNKRLHNQPQQDVTQQQPIPFGAIEDMVILRSVSLLFVAQHAPRLPDSLAGG